VRNKYSEFVKAVVDEYGEDSQYRMVQEECAELIVAINHYLRCRKGAEAVVEEIADVQIMLSQLVEMLQCHDELEVTIERKMTRQMEKLGVGK
jgi:NTP pyrophosphatase (non-canonical NTP hydrolase)